MAIEPYCFHRLRIGTPETLSFAVYNGETIVDPGVTTIGIVDAYDSEVVASGTATDGNGAAARTYALTYDKIPRVNRLTVTWTSATYGPHTFQMEVVGRHLFSLADARAYENGVMSDDTVYPDATLIRLRARIAEEFDFICCRALAPRLGAAVVDGRGRPYIYSPDMHVTAIRRVDYKQHMTGVWTSFTQDELDDLFLESDGYIYRNTLGWFVQGRRNYKLWYEYGEVEVPLDIRDVALMVLRHFAVESNLSSRTLQEQGPFGTIQLAVPGRYGDWYGIPAVDSVLDRWRERRPGFA